MTDQEVKWIPVSAAAAMLKCSRQRVGVMCRVGILRSLLVGSTRLVSIRSVTDRVALRGKGGEGSGSSR